MVQADSRGGGTSSSTGSVGGFGTGSFGTSGGTTLTGGVSYSPLTGYSYQGIPITYNNGIPTFSSSGQPVYNLINGTGTSSTGTPSSPAGTTPYSLPPSSTNYTYNPLTGTYDYTGPGSLSPLAPTSGQPSSGAQVPLNPFTGQTPQTYPAPLGTGTQQTPTGTTGGNIPPIDYFIAQQIQQQTGMPLTSVALGGGGGGSPRMLNLNLPPNIPPQAIFPPAIPQSWAPVTAPNQNAQPGSQNVNMPGPPQGGGSYGNGGNPLQNGPEVIGQYGGTPPGQETPLGVFLPGYGNVELPHPQMPIAGMPHQPQVPGAVPGMSVPPGAMAVTANSFTEPGSAGAYGYTTGDSGEFNFPPPQEGQKKPEPMKPTTFGGKPANTPQRMGSMTQDEQPPTPMEQMGMKNVASKIEGEKYKGAMQAGLDAIDKAAGDLDAAQKQALQNYNDEVHQIDTSIEATHSSKEIRVLQKQLKSVEEEMNGIQYELGINNDGTPILSVDAFIPPQLKQQGQWIRAVQEQIYNAGGDPNDLGAITKNKAMFDVYWRMSPFERQQMYDHLGHGKGLIPNPRNNYKQLQWMPGTASPQQLELWERRVTQRQNELKEEIANYNAGIKQAHEALKEYRKQRLEDYNILKDTQKTLLDKLDNEFKIDNDRLKERYHTAEQKLAKALSAEGRTARLNAVAAQAQIVTNKHMNDFEQKQRDQNRKEVVAGANIENQQIMQNQGQQKIDQRGALGVAKAGIDQAKLNLAKRKQGFNEYVEENSKMPLRKAMQDQAEANPVLKGRQQHLQELKATLNENHKEFQENRATQQDWYKRGKDWLDRQEKNNLNTAKLNAEH